jgi:hypothetical protein
MGGAYGGGASFCEPPLDATQKETELWEVKKKLFFLHCTNVITDGL